MPKVNFKTQDGVSIAGNFYSAATPDTQKALLLLHMMPATKESWDEFSQKARTAGWNVLAIDLRGHGESVKQNGKFLNYRRFDDAEHQASMEDIEAAIEFLEGKNLEPQAIAGASIGANLALWRQSENPEIIKTVLLSAGFNYRGIEANPLAEKLSNPQGVYFLAGGQDGDCGAVAQTLFNLAPIQNKEVEVLETPAHGTDLLKFNPQLAEKIINWLGK